MTNIRSIVRILFLIAAGATAGVALAQAPGYPREQAGGPGYGPGTGHGMMGGHGSGPGHDLGHDLGHEMGPGRMHSPGADRMPGRGERMARLPGLSEDQRAKVRQIMEDTRRRNWNALGQIRTERFKLREMVRGDKVDPGAAVEQKRKLDGLKRQVMQARLEARNQVLALLTPEQRENARSFRQRHWSRHGRG